MAPNKQVSPVIRISRGERDASARATHLEAAFEKYSKTTIERKQMSKTTNFKRIALVAVAALGLGVLSSAPSNAAINADTFTLSAATASQTTAETYTASSATVTLSFLATVANDSISVTAALVSAPAGGTALPVLRLVETTTAVVDSTVVTAAASALGTGIQANTKTSVYAKVTTAASGAKYAVYLATAGDTVAAPVTTGTYVVRITPAAEGASGSLLGSTAQTLTINVTAAPSLDKTPSAATSKVYIQESHSVHYTPTSDSTVVAPKATGTSRAYVYVKSNNAAGSQVTSESITAEISGKGLLQNATGSTTGLSRIIDVKVNETFTVFADGTEGVGTITVKGKTSGVLLATKTITFFGAMASFGTPAIAATDTKVITPADASSDADTTKVSVFALDAGGNKVAGLAGGTDIYAISDSTSIATVAYGSYSATTGYGFIVTGVAAGTATITFANASTLAAATIKSAAFPVKVGSVTPASVKVAFDKATYAPGEKATLTVSLLDANGALLAAKGSEYANIFATGGIVADKALGTGSTSTVVTGIALDALTQVKTFSIEMPVVSGGAIKFSWTGGTGLATANQVAGSTTVTVTDTAAQALAAVTALATTVASLRTLIVTLTNLVLKIQKKVKA